MKKLFPLLIILFLSLLLQSTPALVKADQAILRVPTDYPTIQEAIDAAALGSIILVNSGTYYEHLMVNKTLTIIGQDKATTVIDGDKTGTVVHIKANNVTIDGFTIRNGGEGIRVERFNGSIISNSIIMLNNGWGIFLNKSFANLIDKNLILRNGNPLPGISYGEGIRLDFSNNNIIINNIVSWNVVCGITIISSCSNLIVNNTVEKSAEGIAIFHNESKNNMVHHNNFIWNNFHVVGDAFPLNIWNDSAAGNYWDDYVGLDDGSNGRVAGDGVGDTGLPHLEVDNYPLVRPLQPIPVVWESMAYPVLLLSNSTVSMFRFIQADKKITFDVRGPPDTVGYCNVKIPKNLLHDNPWKILVNNTNITPQATITENQTHTLMYFTYDNGTCNVQIVGTWVIQEFPSTMILPLFMILSLLTVVLTKRIVTRKPKTQIPTLISLPYSFQNK